MDVTWTTKKHWYVEVVPSQTSPYSVREWVEVESDHSELQHCGGQDPILTTRIVYPHITSSHKGPSFRVGPVNHTRRWLNPEER